VAGAWKPIDLMAFLPSGFWVNVLVGDGLIVKKYRKKGVAYAEKCDFRQPPPTTAIF